MTREELYIIAHATLLNTIFEIGVQSPAKKWIEKKIMFDVFVFTVCGKHLTNAVLNSTMIFWIVELNEYLE